MTYPNLSICEKISLITWKNWHVLLGHRSTLLCAIFAPSVFAVILIVLRGCADVEPIETQNYEPIDLKIEWIKLLDSLRNRNILLKNYTLQDPSVIKYFMPKLALAYAPNTNVAFESIMIKSAQYLDIRIDGFANGKLLRAALIKEGYLAGVQFTNRKKEDFAFSGIYPLDLEFTIMFPSELRNFDHIFACFSWSTNTMHNYHDRYENRNFWDNTGGYVGYIREGFATIQHGISMAFIELLTGVDNLPTVKMQRFPFKEHVIDKFTHSLESSLSHIIMFGFLYPCTNFTKYVVKEKERHLKSLIVLLGISGLIQYICWYIKGFLMLLVASLILLIIIKVHWANGYGICSRSTWSVLLVFLISYNAASAAFCLMVSSIFTRSTTAVIFIGVIWILAYLPHVFSVNDNKHTVFVTVLWCMFSNTVMAMGCVEIINNEKYGTGVHWDNLFEKALLNNNFPIGTLILVLLGQSIVYMLIGVLMSYIIIGYDKLMYKYRVYRHAKTRKFSQTRATLRPSKRKAKVYEIDPEYKRTVVEINSITKRYYNDVVVKNVTMTLLNSEITVLMGHNGAGKSTLLSIITGMQSATHGNIVINGVDSKKITDDLRPSMSFCLQQNTLFSHLTVASQLKFFSRIKGLRGDDVTTEVAKYLSVMNLRDKADEFTKNLSVDMQRYLNVCCALAGKSKIVLLDEPSLGMDIGARMSLWEMLLTEKRQRTMIITTQLTDEAEVLSDRVAIMSEGELKCFGSTHFLNMIYGKGYRLVCVKDEHCDAKYVTEIVQKYIPDIEPECELGTELSYRIADSTVISKILDELEENLKLLNITSCSISEPIIEDIFLRMGAINTNDEDSLRLSEIMNGYSVNVEEYDLSFMKVAKYCEGLQLLLSHWIGTFLKRLRYDWYHKANFILQFLIPALITCVIFIVSNAKYAREPLKKINFKLTNYPSTITVLELRGNADDTEDTPFYRRYTENNENSGIMHSLETTKTQLFNEFILSKQATEKQFLNKYLVGATLSNEDITAWFNNLPLHTVPLSLTLVHNAILDYYFNSTEDPHIKVLFEPLPFAFNFDSNQMRSRMLLGHFLSSSLTFYICFIYSFCILYLINERSTRFKLLQCISGLRPLTFLLSNLFFEFLKVLIITFLVVLVIVIFQRFSQFRMSEELFFVVLLIFGICIIPFNYLVSSLFSDPLNGFTFITVMNMYGGVIFSTYLEFEKNKYTHILNFNKITEWFLSIFPHFSLCNALLKIYTVTMVHEICNDKLVNVMSVTLAKCRTTPNCCEVPEAWTWGDMGILPQITLMLGVGILSTIIIILLEYRKMQLGYKIPHNNKKQALHAYKHRHEMDEIDTAIREELRVRSLKPIEFRKKALVLNAVGKTFGNETVLDRIFLVAERCECLGILGPNNCGKSTLLKILTCDERMSFGRVHVEGISMISDRYSMLQRIGYWPQIDAVLNEYTCYDILRFMCLFHGIPRNHIENMCEGLAKIVDIIEQMDKYIGMLSPGCKRRLSAAIAIIGSPSVLYFDEYASGIDPAGRRQLCNIMCSMRQKGATIIFTSLVTNETERLCTRICLFSSGMINCIDTATNLNNNYVKGYVLRVKVKFSIPEGSFFDKSALSFSISFLHSNPFIKIQMFMEKHFPSSIMKEQIGNYIAFFIPLDHSSLSHIFKQMKRNAFHLNIENFSITRNTLPLVFNELIEKSKRRESDALE